MPPAPLPYTPTPEAQMGQQPMGQPPMGGGMGGMEGAGGPLDAPMAGRGEETGQAEAPQQPGAGGQPVGGWQPGIQGGPVYGNGLGPVTGQVQQLKSNDSSTTGHVRNEC